MARHVRPDDADDLRKAEFQGTPRFQLAARQVKLLKRLGLAIVLGIAGGLGFLFWNPAPNWRALVAVETAVLLLLAARVMSVWWVVRWRLSAVPALLPSPPATLEPLISSPSITAEPVVQLRVFRLQIRRWLSWRGIAKFAHAHQQALVRVIFSLFALTALALAAPEIIGPAKAVALLKGRYLGQVDVAYLAVLVLLGMMFSGLVVERYFANRSPAELPESQHITWLLRVCITVSLLLAAYVLLSSPERDWLGMLLATVAVLPAAIAVEFLLRTALSFFAPPVQGEPGLFGESLIAGFWRWPIQPFTQLHDELHLRFGIDLRQSWAFAYIRKSLAPVVSVLLGLAWLLSGLTEIGLTERGIYERFGAPLAVWQPGLHLGLPWPLGRVQRVENGLVHELSVAQGEEGTSKDSGNQGNAGGTAEGPAPESANRLWDASHLAEKSQVIASEVITAEGSRQSFHIVNMDVRLLYRIGLSDSAALQARYRSANTAALIRSTANRILVEYFATRTLEGVLGEARTHMATDIGRRLQADLVALDAGVEILATVLEAIHPPAAAANAYHSVQAAQINAQAIVARERGKGLETTNMAQLRAGIAMDQAKAVARETLVSADIAKRRFVAEREAHQQGGKAFLMEQYLAQLVQGLGGGRLIVVDHRLPAASSTIDLRDLGATPPAAATEPPIAAPTGASSSPATATRASAYEEAP